MKRTIFELYGLSYTNITIFHISKTGNGFTFPSGHVMGALIAWGMLAYVVLITYSRRRWSSSPKTKIATATVPMASE